LALTGCYCTDSHDALPKSVKTLYDLGVCGIGARNGVGGIDRRANNCVAYSAWSVIMRLVGKLLENNSGEWATIDVPIMILRTNLTTSGCDDGQKIEPWDCGGLMIGK
jgi:hypothetical protein